LSIGKRLIDLARGELNSLLERAARLDDDAPAEIGEDEMGTAGDPGPRSRGARLQDLSDEELEAEIERRHLEKELRDGTRPRPAEPPRKPTEPPRKPTGSGPRKSTPPPRPPQSAPVDEVARAYAALEVRQGADFETVRKAYRTLMRKYHPDRHAHSPEKQKDATAVAQKLTQAYDVLEKRLRK
jgi:DnaJ-domain-containing protein 1